MTALGTGGLFCGLERPELLAAASCVEGGFAAGELLGRVEFANEGRVEMDAAFGSELDGRLFTSLEGLSEGELVTPEERFYLRTRASRILPEAAGWTIKVDGLVANDGKSISSRAKAHLAPAAMSELKLRPPFSLQTGAETPHAAGPNVGAKAPTPTGIAAERVVNMSKLRALERPLGLHLMECAGNTRAAHFGMISVGDWAGVPISELLATLKPLPRATRVLVNGFDKYVADSVTSTPGASWIFTFEELRSAGAFLATKLNGKPLSKDHGAPVRLVAPGWYGCTCIKWVDRITLVDDSAEATSQMIEYASRTHQNGSPRLARDFAPARIDNVAMPIRVEKWRGEGKLKYRVVGLLWGGTETVRKLGIRFNPEEEYVAVETLPVPQTTPWTLWSHSWTPAQRGMYTIRLAVLEPQVHARRLESGYYARSVEIDEV